MTYIRGQKGISRGGGIFNLRPVLASKGKSLVRLQLGD